MRCFTRRHLVLAAAVTAVIVAGVGATVAVAVGTDSSEPDLGTEKAPQWLEEKAQRWAADYCGDEHPTSATWTLTTVANYDQAIREEDAVDAKYADREYYVVVMRGEFVYKKASTRWGTNPDGTHYEPNPPTGELLVLVIDPKTHEAVIRSLYKDASSVDSARMGTMNGFDFVK